MHSSYFLLTLVALVCLFAISTDGQKWGTACADMCDGQCRKKHCNRDEYESNNQYCKGACDAQNGRICCVKDQPVINCESDCGGTCRKHCKRGEQDAEPVDECVESCPTDYRCCVPDEEACKNDCNGQCRKNHCNRDEYESYEPSCVKDCGDKKGRICCVPEEPEYECEGNCGGKCRKHCKRGEQDAEPVDECVATCLPGYRCCVTDEEACKNDCNGQCRKNHCNRDEYESNEPSCMKDCDDKKGRICCVPW